MWSDQSTFASLTDDGSNAPHIKRIQMPVRMPESWLIDRRNGRAIFRVEKAVSWGKMIVFSETSPTDLRDFFECRGAAALRANYDLVATLDLQPASGLRP